MKRQALCIHGHFYQPPREDPFSGEIPLEPGAAPFSNWNERIYAQCYKPNAALGNFERISFNIGPTLVDWMRQYHPDTLQQIIVQDRRNMDRYRVGNAMAQSYNHSILPLATRTDKITQVRWGIADFEFLFGHKPLGMWLPETAVDMETLEVLVENGIEFTILAPWQAAVDNVDVSQPYWVNLPDSKGRIAAFFYHNISGQISFAPEITVNADWFIKQYLKSLYPPPASRTEPQIIIIASDGELYGHHQPFRDQFLEYLTKKALADQEVESTYTGLWYRQHPPRRSIAIRPNTSWSCHHGVLRWSENCDCTPHSEWKGSLRTAFIRLAESIDAEYLRALKPLKLADPWELRHRYIHVINNETTVADLVGTLSNKSPGEDLLRKIDLLLQAQYERQRMFTSCGWFFDDFDRIEPRNNVAYAAKAVDLVQQATGVSLASKAKAWLMAVRSWRSGVWASTVFKYQVHRARSARGPKTG